MKRTAAFSKQQSCRPPAPACCYLPAYWHQHHKLPSHSPQSHGIHGGCFFAGGLPPPRTPLLVTTLSEITWNPQLLFHCGPPRPPLAACQPTATYCYQHHKSTSHSPKSHGIHCCSFIAGRMPPQPPAAACQPTATCCWPPPHPPACLGVGAGSQARKRIMYYILALFRRKVFF